jgi:hypothetical protein
VSCQCRSWDRLGEHVGHHVVIGEVPQLDGSLLHVVFEEVTLHTDVFGLRANQGIVGVRNGALVFLPDGGGFSDGGVEDLPLSPISCRRWSPSLVASAAE